MEKSKFSDKVIFSEFSGNAIVSDETGQNIMDCRDEVIYIWDRSDGCLLTQGLREECKSYQLLRPTNPPGFDVKFLSVNNHATKACLWGPMGIFIIDLPQRFGPYLEFENGKESIIVKSRELEGLDLSLGSTILQVRWHCTDGYESTLIVLLSNNILYNFIMLTHDRSPIRSSRIGSRPSSRLRTLAALGETAVDFCFVSLEPELKKSGLLLLRGNGEVFLMIGDIDSDEFYSEGLHLPISPLPDDNYLNDACAILCLPGKPTAVVVATSRGMIYHTVLVPLDADQLAVPVQFRKRRLLVIESVLLDAISDDFHSCPVRLLADPGHSRRYIALHNAGIHSVVLEVLSGIEQLLEKSNLDTLDNGSCISFQSHSISTSNSKFPESLVEYLVCSGRPMQGCCVFPYTLLAIDANKKVIELPLRRIELVPLMLYTPHNKEGSGEGPLTSELKKPYEQQIEQLLYDSRVLPRLRFPTQELPKDQIFAFVVKVGSLIRKDVVPRYRQIRSILAQRIQLINSLKELQKEEIRSLELERAEIQLSAESFAERVQTAVEELEVQRERVQNVAHRIATVKPVKSDAEVKMETAIAEIESKVEEYTKTLERLKKSRAYQDVKIKEHYETVNSSVLNNKQANIVKECLAAIGDNIGQLARKVHELNNLLGFQAE